MSDFTGIYRGAVHDINDPELRGRLQCLVPAVLGDAPSGWAEPLLPTAADPVWSVGDRVWVMFEGGDPNKPVYFARLYITSGDVTPGSITRVSLAADSITADLLMANDAFIETLQSVDLSSTTVTGLTLQTDPDPEHGIHLDLNGIRAYGPAGGAPFFDVNPALGVAIVAGLIKTSSLTVSPAPGEKTTLAGTTEIAAGGSVKLTGGTSAPATAPAVGTGYDTKQFTNDGEWPNRYGWTTDGTNWYTVRYIPSPSGAAQPHRLERWSSAGALTAYSDITGDYSTVKSSVVVGSFLYTLNFYGTDVYLRRYALPTSLNQALSATTYRIIDADLTATTRQPALGYNAVTGRFLVAHSRAANDTLRVSEWALPSSGIDMTVMTHSDSSFTVPSGLATITHGSFDLGGNFYLFTTRGTGNIRPMTTVAVATEPTGLQWPSGMTGKVGVGWDGTAFKSMDQTGLMRTYTGIWSTVTGDMTKWVSNTLATATAETDQSPRASVVLPKRAKLLVTTSPIIAGSGPDRVRIYVGQGLTDPGRAQMARQTNPAVGVTSMSYSSLVAPPGVNQPPVTNTFGAGLPTQLVDKNDNILINSDGEHVNGTVGTGVFRSSVDGRVTTFAPQTWTTYTPVWTAATTNPTLVDGTLTGRYIQQGKTVDFSITLTIGASTTFGSGGWRFTLPVASRVSSTSNPIVSQSRLPGNLIRWALNVDANTIQVVDAAGVQVSGTTVSWVSGNVMMITGRYEAA